MKRILWTVALAMVGFGFALRAFQFPPPGNVHAYVLGAFWGGAIGFGFGTIFQQRSPRKGILIYWAVTVGLVAMFFGLAIGGASLLASEIVAAAIGALVGLLLGSLQLRSLRRASH